MIRVNIISTRMKARVLLKTLHFEDNDLALAKRWAHDLVVYPRGKFAEVWRCVGPNCPKGELIATIGEEEQWKLV